MHHTCKLHGVCSRTVSFDLDEKGIISNIEFAGGCHGNLQGIARLSEGKPAEELAGLLDGIRCGFKNTSCPDQFARALRGILARKPEKT